MSDGSVVMAVLRLLVSLAVVLVLLVGLARWAARRGAGGWRPGGATVRVDVLARRALGKSSTLQVVRVGEQVMVLGVTEHAVSVLRELDGEDLVTPAAEATAPAPQASTFAAAVRRVAVTDGGVAARVDGEVPAPADGEDPLPTRASRRAARTAQAPTGWPWSAAAFVLARVGAHRG